jgi:hypothetical protein
MITETDTWGEAHDICADQTLTLVSIILEEDGPDSWQVGLVTRQGGGVSHDLLPNYPLNLSSTSVSLLGMLVWLFVSPHQMEVAKVLDRKRTSPPPSPPPPFTSACLHRQYSPLLFFVKKITVGSYYLLRLLGNIVYTARSLYSCTASRPTWAFLFATNYLIAFSVSIISTNLLCHRYLYEKAKTLTEKM